MSDKHCSHKKSIDLATIVGLLGAFALVFAAIYLGGSVGSLSTYLHTDCTLGTIAVTLICFSFKRFWNFFCNPKTMSANLREPNDGAVQILQISQLARQKGILTARGSRK